MVVRNIYARFFAGSVSAHGNDSEESYRLAGGLHGVVVVVQMLFIKITTHICQVLPREGRWSMANAGSDLIINAP